MMGIRFKAEDLSRMLPPQSGWQKLEVQNVIETASNDKLSVNFIFTLEIIASAIDDKNIGRTVTRYYNSKAMSFFGYFLAAVWNLSMEDAAAKISDLIKNDEELDPASFKGSQAWNELVDEVYNNKPQVKVSDNWAYADAEPPF